MNYTAFKLAVEDAKTTMYRADQMAKNVAPLMVGRLRFVSKDDMWSSHQTLKALKKELSQYNARTGKWNN